MIAHIGIKSKRKRPIRHTFFLNARYFAVDHQLFFLNIIIESLCIEHIYIYRDTVLVFFIDDSYGEKARDKVKWLSLVEQVDKRGRR